MKEHAIAEGGLRRGSIVAAVAEQASCNLGDEVIVLSLRGGVYYGLNSVAARVWELVQQPRMVEETLAILLEEYEVERERCERDVLLLLRDLLERELITVSNGASA